MKICYINQNSYQQNIHNVKQTNMTSILNNCQLYSKLDYVSTVAFQSSIKLVRSDLKMLPKYYKFTNIKYENLTNDEKAFSEALRELIKLDDKSQLIKEKVSNFKKTYRFVLSDAYDENDKINNEKLTYILTSMIEGLDCAKNRVVVEILTDFVFNNILTEMDLKEKNLDKVLLVYVNEQILQNPILKIYLSDVIHQSDIVK